MKLSKEKEQELREEFYKEDAKGSFDGIDYPENDEELEADFWINKINTELEEQKEEITDKIKRLSYIDTTMSGIEKGYELAKNDVLQIINEKIK